MGHSTATMRKKENLGMPGIRPMANMAAPAIQSTRGWAKSCWQISSQRFVGGGAGDDQAAGDGDQQGGNHGDQAVADRKNGVRLKGIAQRDAELKNFDQESGDDIDRGDQNGCERVALVEAGSSVHGPVKFGFAGDAFAAGARLVLRR